MPTLQPPSRCFWGNGSSRLHLAKVRECERTWDTGGHPWVPPAVERAPRRGAGAQGREAGVTLQRGRAAIGEVLCRSQLPVCNVRDGTLSLWESPKKRGFSGVSLHNPTKVTKSHGSSVWGVRGDKAD